MLLDLKSDRLFQLPTLHLHPPLALWLWNLHRWYLQSDSWPNQRFYPLITRLVLWPLCLLRLWSTTSGPNTTSFRSSVTPTSWWGRTTSRRSATCTSRPSCTTSKSASWSQTTSTHTVVSDLTRLHMLPDPTRLHMLPDLSPVCTCSLTCLLSAHADLEHPRRGLVNKNKSH